jgi:hypothetical protein
VTAAEKAMRACSAVDEGKFFAKSVQAYMPAWSSFRVSPAEI